MSLLQKASIITTPTAYAEDYLYSIKPAQSLGQELVTNGTFDANSNWARQNVTISGGKANFNIVGGAYAKLSQSITYVTGRKYKLTAVVNGTTGKQIRFRDDSANAGGLTTSNGKVTMTGSNQSVTLEWTANGNSDVIAIERQTTSGDYTFTVDNVSIKEVTDADFDFTRNSTGTRLNEDYLIEDVPYNLVLQSNQFDTTWFNSSTTETGGQSGYDGSNNAWLLSLTGAAGRIIQTISQSGVQTFSVYAKAGTYSFLDMFVLGASIGRAAYFDLSNGTVGTTFDVLDANIQNVGNGWYRCSIRFNDTISNIRLYPAVADNDLTGASGNIYIQNAQLVKGDQPKDYLKTTDRLDIPRIDYTNGEGSILLEPQSTNRVTYSNDYTQSSWVKQNFTANSETTTAPDGLPISGYDFGDGFLYIDLPAMVNGASYTNSVYIKANKNATIGLRNGGGGGGTDDTNINLTTSWQRFTGTSTAPDTNIGRFLIDNRASKGFGVSDLKVFVYGAQNEQLSYATSLIHTSGSAVTRSADAANNAGNSDLINSTEGVLYAEIKALADDGTNRTIGLLGDSNNFIELAYRDSSNTIRGLIKTSGAVEANIQHTLSDSTSFNKIACKYKANDVSLYVNGQQVGVDTSASMPSNLNEINFYRFDVTEDFYGNAKMVAVFKEALSDTELECLTGYNNHELYMNYYNRLSYLGLAEEYNVESDINNYIL